MSHQTGIKSNTALKQTMAEAKGKNNRTRLFKVVINTKSEELELGEVASGVLVHSVKADWATDFEQYARKVVLANEPCYLFFKLDSTDASGNNDWAFILYSPEYSNVRKKMLYASTKSTLKKEFGTGILFDYFADSDEALTVDSFRAWIEDKQMLAKGVNHEDDVDVDDDDDDGPVHQNFVAGLTSNTQLLTATEDERRKVKKQEYEMSLEKGAKKSSQFQFPLRPEAINALLDFRDNRIVYLKLKVNLATEEIQLDSTATSAQHPVLANGSIDVRAPEHQHKRLLPPVVGSDDAVDDGNVGFHIFSLTHLDPEANRVQKTVFCFVMPTEKTTVRQRIAYSACLNSLFDSITNRINVPIDKRIEVDSANEATVAYVSIKLYPELDTSKAIDSKAAVVDQSALKFTKPRGPPSRGPRRIIK